MEEQFLTAKMEEQATGAISNTVVKREEGATRAISDCRQRRVVNQSQRYLTAYSYIDEYKQIIRCHSKFAQNLKMCQTGYRAGIRPFLNSSFRKLILNVCISKVEEDCSFVMDASRDACSRDDTDLVKISLFSSFVKVSRTRNLFFYL